MSTAVALHEAGHAVASLALGFKAPGPVTIVGNEHWGGMAFIGEPPVRVTDADVAGVHLLNLPLPLVPHRLRRKLELSVMATMAGDIAELLWTPTPPPPPVSPKFARRLADDAPPVCPVLPGAEAVALAEANKPQATDAEHIDRLLSMLHDDRWAILEAHRLLLDRATVQLLRDHEPAVLALAEVLDEHQTLSAAHWRSIVRGAGTTTYRRTVA